MIFNLQINKDCGESVNAHPISFRKIHIPK